MKNMEIKLIEIRDKCTFIPALAVLMESSNVKEAYLLRRAGYGIDTNLVLLAKLQGGEACYDENNWNSTTMRIAHYFLKKHWNEFESGSVVDTEYLSGESKEPKKSEMVDYPG